MSAPDADGTTTIRPTGRFARFLASPVAIVLAILITVALVAVAAISAVRFFSPSVVTPIVLGEPMPTAFSLELSARSSPMLNRGQTLTLQVSSAPSSPIERLELWDDDHPYIVIDDPDLIPVDSVGQVTLSLDFTPVTAGGHVLFLRAVDASGNVAQSAPIGSPVLELPLDRGVSAADPDWLLPADITLRSAPGDTFEKVAHRLGLEVADLRTFETLEDPTGILPTGTRISAPVPPDPFIDIESWPQVPWVKGITAVEKDCQIIVTSTMDKPVRLYAGAGNVAIGEVPAKGEKAFTEFPVGPVSITGLVIGETKPLKPVSAVLPDECAKGGWTGDAVITGGLLVTETLLEKPYVYLSIDKGEWQRIPARDNETLSSGAVNDLRQLVSLGTYDQLDLEVWSSPDGVTASKVAAGQFCRADMTAQNLGASSQSGGECDPPGTAPGTPGGGAVAVGLHIVASVPAGSAVELGDGDPEDPDNTSWAVGYGPVTLQTNAEEQGYSKVRYQFGYFPLSQSSPLLNPPGVFHYIDTGTGPITIDPRKWQHSEIGAEGPDQLALEDEIGLAIAQSHAAAGQGIVDDFYIRAIPIGTSTTNTPISLNVATGNVRMVLPSSFDGKWPTIEKPTISISPGVDEHASWTSEYEDPATSNWNPAIQRWKSGSVTGLCHEVISYPQPGVYTQYPLSAPHSRPKVQAKVPGFGTDNKDFITGVDYKGPPKPGDVLVEPGQKGYSDLDLAQARFDKKYVYCMDAAAAGKRYTAAYDEAKKNAKCGLGCVLTFVVYGTFLGLQAGGPVGAIFGGIAGLALGIMSAANPAFYKDLKEAWDAIAGVYNAVMDKVWDVVHAINPICQGIGAFDGEKDKAQNFCDGVFKTVGGAVIEYYTGLPPSLATSAELEAASDGELSAALQLIINEGLKQFGLSCKTFEIDSESAGEIAAELAKSDTVLNAEGNASGCAFLASTLISTMRKALDERQNAIMGAVTGLPPIPGLKISPISDQQAYIAVQAPSSMGPSALAFTGLGDTCPVIVNTTVSEGGTSYTFVPEHSSVRLLAGTPTAAGLADPTPFWYGAFVVGVMPQTTWSQQPDPLYNVKDPQNWYLAQRYSYFDRDNRLLTSAPTGPGTAYLHVAISSPCFTSDYVIEAQKYEKRVLGFLVTPGAFRNDARQAVGYW
ncbi:MAG: hypothetical protein ABI632_03145 [Pseudolysinimonas sp.]